MCKVATKSLNLKGTFVRTLKESSFTVTGVEETLIGDVALLQVAQDFLME